MFVSSLVSPGKTLREANSLDFTSVYRSLQLVDGEEIFKRGKYASLYRVLFLVLHFK